MSRWKLELLSGGEFYEFEINPNAQDNPHPTRSIKWDFHPTLGFSGTRQGRSPHDWSFSGVLRSQAQYDALLLWVGKKVKVRLTDDLGNKRIIRLLEFSPQQTAGARSRHAPWRMTYTMRCLIFDDLEFLATVDSGTGVDSNGSLSVKVTAIESGAGTDNNGTVAVTA